MSSTHESNFGEFGLNSSSTGNLQTSLSENSGLAPFLNNLVPGPLSRSTSLSPQRSPLSYQTSNDFHLSNEEDCLVEGNDYEEDIENQDYDILEDQEESNGAQDLRIQQNKSPEVVNSGKEESSGWMAVDREQEVNKVDDEEKDLEEARHDEDKKQDSKQEK